MTQKVHYSISDNNDDYCVNFKMKASHRQKWEKACDDLQAHSCFALLKGLAIYKVLTPWPPFVKPGPLAKSVLKNWWVKCWAKNANKTLVFIGSGLNSVLVKSLFTKNWASGSRFFPKGKRICNLRSPCLRTGFHRFYEVLLHLND